MHNLSNKRLELYRKRWIDSVSRCHVLFARYNELCKIMHDYEYKDEWSNDDMIRYKEIYNDRLLCDCELVNARKECISAWDDYYYEFPFFAVFDKIDLSGGDFH